MERSQQCLSQFTTSAMEALKRAYEECPNSMAGSYIIIASNAIIRLESELERSAAGTAPCRRSHADGGAHVRNEYDAAA
ncbi:MAG TPA: hypothetical protein VIH45_04255 [Desulfuromonadaceae bacterium]